MLGSTAGAIFLAGRVQTMSPESSSKRANRASSGRKYLVYELDKRDRGFTGGKNAFIQGLHGDYIVIF